MTEPVRGDPGTDDAEAALESVEPDRLLPGESADTKFQDDARHWIKVYTELLAFKVDISKITEERVRSMEPDAALEVAATDVKVLLAEERRFERRLAFWRARSSAMEQQ